MSHFFDFFINLRIFFNIGVRTGYIGFRLIIIVIGYKVFHGIIREKFFELTIQLCCQRFIVGNYQCRTIGLSNDVCHSECFTGACYPQHNLFGISAVQPIYQLGYGLRLISGRFIFRYKFKIRHNHSPHCIISKIYFTRFR